MFQPLPNKLCIVWSDITWEGGKRDVGPIDWTFDQSEAEQIKFDQELWVKRHEPPATSSVVVVYVIPVPPIVPVHKSRQSDLYVVSKADVELILDRLKDVISSIELGRD